MTSKEVDNIVSEFSNSALTSILRSYLLGEGHLIFVPLLSNEVDNTLITLSTLRLANRLQSILPLSKIERRNRRISISMKLPSMESLEESEIATSQKLKPIKKVKRQADTSYFKHFLMKATLLMNNHKEEAMRLSFLKSLQRQKAKVREAQDETLDSQQNSSEITNSVLKMKLIESQLLDLRKVNLAKQGCRRPALRKPKFRNTTRPAKTTSPHDRSPRFTSPTSSMRSRIETSNNPLEHSASSGLRLITEARTQSSYPITTAN